MRRVCLKTHLQVANNRVNSCTKDRKHFSHLLARCHVSVVLPACLFISLIVILSIPRLLYLMSELICPLKVNTQIQFLASEDMCRMNMAVCICIYSRWKPTFCGKNLSLHSQKTNCSSGNDVFNRRNISSLILQTSSVMHGCSNKL